MPNKLFNHPRVVWSHRLRRLCYYLRIILTHLFSTSGLCFLVVSYALLGALIFPLLELEAEQQRLNEFRARLVAERRQMAMDMWSFTEQLNILHPQAWQDQAEAKLIDYELNVTRLLLQLKDGGQATMEHLYTSQWSFPEALLYSVTVVTTIGKFIHLHGDRLMFRVQDTEM